MIIQFPVKQQMQLTKDMEERIEKIVKDYLLLLAEVVDYLAIDDSKEQYQEAVDLVATKLIEAFELALDEIET